MEHGGNPELKNRFGQRTLDIVIDSGGEHLIPRVDMILDSGVDINSIGWCGCTPIMNAVVSRRFDLALHLLELGADPGIYVEGTNQKLIHYVVRTEENPNLPLTGRAKALQMQLLQELADRGEDAEAARADNKRWGKIQTPSQLAELNLEKRRRSKSVKNV